MNGQRIPRTPIVVDYWNLGKIPPRCLFFLTHMHADHTSGLNASWPYPIHCTAVTGKLLVRKFKINPKLVVELEVGESKMLHVDRSGSHVTITVTTIDANHCPGSAMFLFEGYFGRILYTGDFRFSPSMLDNPLLNGSRSIDVLYLDNTYCDPSCNFPTREEATRTLISLIGEKRDHYKTVIIGLHTLGKEELLVELATSLQQWVGVSSERMTTLKLLELPDVFTTDVSGSFVQVHPFYLVAKNRLAEMSSEDVLAVLPTCLYSGHGALPQPAGVVVIPYSDHSSFEELKSFVKAVRPRCVKPIVKSFSGDRSYISALRGDMSVFNEYLDPSPPHEYRMPTGTEDLTNSSQISYPSTLSGSIPTPTVRRSHSYSSGNKVQLRSRSRGVRFLSPTKSKSPENLEIDNSSHSNNQNSPQLKNPDDTRQDAILDEDISDSKGVTVGSATPFSESNIVPLIDLTFTEQQFCVSKNSLQTSSRDQPIPLLAQVEPASDLTVSQLKMNQTCKPNDGATFVQTKLSAFTKTVDNKSNSNASTIVQTKYLSGRRNLLEVSLSLEEAVTCARVLPLESLKLGRYGHTKKDANRDEPCTMEDDRRQKTVKDIEDSNEATDETELIDNTTIKVPVLSESYQESVKRVQPHVREETADDTKADDVTNGDTRTSSPSTCARLVPIECVKLSRSGRGMKERDGGKDDPTTMEGDGHQKRIMDAGGSKRCMQKIEPIDKPATPVLPVSYESRQDSVIFVQMCEVNASPSTVESMETEGSSLAEAQVTSTEVIDLTHLDSSQSLFPKSPQSNPSTPPRGKLQNGNSDLRSTEHPTSLTAVTAESSSDHCNGRGSSPRSADSANILTPLPRIGSPKATDALYGKEPSQRSQNSGSGVKRKLLRPPLTFLNNPFTTSSSFTASTSYSSSSCSLSNFLQTPSSKKLKLSTGKGETGAQTTTAVEVAKSRRVLPAYLQPDTMNNQKHYGANFNHSCDGYSWGQVDATVGPCVCGCSETQPVPTCRQCCSSIIKLKRSGLLGRLSKVDLSSPEVCQVIHSAIDAVACQEQSNPITSRRLSPLRCTCEDKEATKCFSGLEEYISDNHSQSSKSNANFDNWVIETNT